MSERLPTTHDVLNAYRCGLFPMAEGGDSDIFYWYDPQERGQLSIDKLHVSRSLRRLIKKQPFILTADQAFEEVITGCAETTPDRPETWINRPIKDLFLDLHQEGHAHSVECWDDTGALVGGIYGLSVGAVFAGESMFSRAPNASKVGLTYLAALLWQGRYKVFDTQFINPHLIQFGAYEISRHTYRRLLAHHNQAPAKFNADKGLAPYDLLRTYLAALKS